MQFENFDKSIQIKNGALCFWSWNDKLEKEELRRQMEEFAEGRFSGVLIHSRAGLRIPYMGKEWFDCWRFAVAEAERLGLEVWIYDEDGWPSGFAGGRVPAMGEEHWMKQLHFSERDAGEPENRIAAWRKTESGYRVIPKDEAVNGDLICWYTADKNYVDLLSEGTVKCFIEKTHERYKQEVGEAFGSVIKGVFTDEPQIAPYPWSTALEKTWFSRWRTSLSEKLYLLVKEEEGFESFRWKFRDLVSDLLYNSFTKQISEWCSRNNLIFTGHFSEEDGLVMQVHGNGGTMRHYQAMHMPGIDHLGNRYTSPVLLKQPSSVARQLGKPEVLSETYGCAGWEVTFDQLCRIWGRQSVLGITKPCFHLSAYSLTGRRKRDYPAFYSYQEPWWQQFPAVINWINGLNSLMCEGERIVDVLVISPLAGVSALYGTKAAERISCEYRCLIENLLDAQVDVELGDEKIIAEYADVKNGKFCIGSAEYRLVIVPETVSLIGKTFSLLREYAGQGGEIWYCGDSFRQDCFTCSELPAGDIVQNRRNMLEKCLSFIEYQRPAALYSTEYHTLLHGAFIHTRRLDGAYRCHIWTGPEFAGTKAVLNLYAPEGENTVALVDIASAARTELFSVSDGNILTAFLEISPDSSIVVEWYRNDKKTKPVHCDISVKEWYVTDCSIRLADNNALTLDYASVSVNGGPYSEKKPVLRMLCELYKIREKLPRDSDMQVCLRYDFECGEDLATDGISAVFEDEFVIGAEINGEEIKGKSGKWWIDRKFGEYAIGHYLHPGRNSLILKYELPQPHCGTEVSGFESERNRFYFSVEPESVYIKGDFDVVPETSAVDRGGFYRIDTRDFRLASRSEKHMGDITSQNAWFYRGNAEYTFKIRRNGQKKSYKLLLENTNAAGAEILVGGKQYTMLSFKEPLDISGALADGENTVTVRLLGNNRNLFGPHHHIKGETAIVGPDTFEGRKGFEDFVSPDIRDKNTWTDSYHFIPFGCGRIKVAEETQEQC